MDINWDEDKGTLVSFFGDPSGAEYVFSEWWGIKLKGSLGRLMEGFAITAACMDGLGRTMAQWRKRWDECNNASWMQ